MIAVETEWLHTHIELIRMLNIKTLLQALEKASKMPLKICFSGLNYYFKEKIFPQVTALDISFIIGL